MTPHPLLRGLILTQSRGNPVFVCAQLTRSVKGEFYRGTKMSKEHLLCYIRRDSLASWKLDSLERGTRNHPVLAYGSNDPIFAKFAKRGNVLWVIGTRPDGPPSLEAKIEISGELYKNKEWDCEVKGSSSGSAFFGANDASNTVMEIVFKSNNSLWSLQDKYSSVEWKNIYGRELQSPRRLAPLGERINRHRSPGAAGLEQLARRAMNRSVFISWKHTDNNRNWRRFINALTVELTKCGFSVWWDQVALTDVGVVDEYPASKKDEMMNRLLHHGISQTTAVLALWTARYGTSSTPKAPNWTLIEWHVPHAVARIAMVSGVFTRKPQMAEPDRVVRIPQNPDPREAVHVARRFKQAYDSMKGHSRENPSSVIT